MESVDLISDLPKIILHDILSRLPEQDAARTSVLSKAWSDTWSTFPILSISDGQFIGRFPQKMEDFLRKRKNFVDYVNRTLLRFHGQGMAVREFKLIVNNFDPDYMSSHMDLWMKLASESGVEVLEVCLSEDDECYTLPPGIFEARSLNKLVLMGGIRVDQAFLSRPIKFSSLQVLSLWSVILGDDEKAIENLISSCPLIENVTLKCCSVSNPVSTNGLREPRTTPLKSLSISGPKLKGVDVQGIQEVYVDAPSLENFCYCPDDLHAPYKMNLDRCRNLRALHLWSVKNTIITDQWFLELFLKFPILESLKLDTCTLSKRINISSVKLKVLELKNGSHLNEVNIDAPSLLSFGYSGNGATIISFLKSSSQLEVNIWIGIQYRDLGILKEFIQNIKPQDVLASASLSLFIFQPIGEVNPDVLQVSSPPPSIKHLDLRAVPSNETLHLPLVSSLLSSCCPAIISMSLLSRFCSRAFVELFYEVLMGRKGGDCYCSSGHTKCWWHGLKDVKVTSSVKTDENVDFKTMLDALPTFAPRENITFRLEW